jgi:dihydropteroate synthase
LYIRPGAAPVGIEDEIARAVPVVRGLSDLGAKVSIDTRHAPVMEAAIEAGATIINDVTALSHDPDSLDLAVASGLPVILMHMQGDPGTMQDNPQYEDAAQDVFDYLKQRVAECEAAGMDRSRIAIDPGIGFGKTLDHNLDILARLNLYRDFKCPVLLGVSRKTFIGKLGGDAAPKERLGGSLAAVLAAAARGVRLFRVHDVAETRQALTIWQAIEKK